MMGVDDLFESSVAISDYTANYERNYSLVSNIQAAVSDWLSQGCSLEGKE